MGKIRIKTIGLEDVEKQEKEEAKKRREVKDLKKPDKPVKSVKKEKIHAKGGKGGDPTSPKAPKGHGRMKQIELGEAEREKLKKAEELIKSEPAEGEEKKQKKARPPKMLGRNYRTAKTKIKKDKLYTVTEAVALVRDIAYASFDETVELHINIREGKVSGTVRLPHGTGKKIRVAVADDALLAKIEKGVIDFDVLVATPAMMPKLAKHAKVLGPRGLMPNPKAGTVTEAPEEAVKKYADGAVRFRTEAKAPIIHQAVGKLSYKDRELVENIQAFLAAVGPDKIETAFLKSTMSPSVRVGLQ